MAGKDFLRHVEDACDTALVSVGFKRLRRGCVVWPFSPEFLGWVGLNRGNHGTMLRLNPFVGIHAAALMEMCAELGNGVYKKAEIATYAVHLGTLLPDFAAFEFHEGEDVTSEAKRLATTLADTGVKYMASLSSYELLLPLLKDRVFSLGGYPQRYATALYLSGRADLACQFVNSVLNREGEWRKIPTESFTQFGQRFLQIDSGTDRD